VAVNVRWPGAQGFVVLFLPALGHGVAAALTNCRHVPHRTTLRGEAEMVKTGHWVKLEIRKCLRKLRAGLRTPPCLLFA
jgi:hypothetical protein